MLDSFADILVNFPEPLAFAAVFGILLACGLGVPIPEDITLFAAGYYCYKADSNVFLMIVVSFAGVLIGDTIIFTLGHRYGRRIAARWPFSKFLPAERLDYVSGKLKTGGRKLIFAARFMPGLRAPVYFTAGTLHLPYRTFFLYDGMAAVLSVPLIVYSVFHFGHEVDEVVHVIQKVEHGIALLILAVVLVFAGKWYISKRKLKKTQAITPS